MLSDDIKAAITPEEVIRRYGFQINRAGFIKCPFHTGDTQGSLKVYPKKWHCFGCGKGGSVIDFAQELFGLSNRAAMARLNSDFGLHLEAEKETPAERSERVRAAERAQKELEAYRTEYERQCYEYRRLWLAKQEGYGHSDYAEACKRLDAFDYWFERNPWR